MNFRHMIVAAVGIVAGTFLTSSAQAVDLVTNGQFLSTTNGPGQLGYNTNATGWSTSGYNFLYAPGTADSGGSIGQYGGVSLWGPQNGSANGLPATSPGGGNFVALDGDFQTFALNQTLNGLTAGQTYVVSFYYGYAQQYGFTGNTIQNLTVSLGSSSEKLADFRLPSEGFSGWNLANVALTADGTSDVLSFLAYGNLPVPPFALLSDVSVSAVPLPGALTLFGSALVGMGALARRRAKKKAAIA
jgi:hypothetical protein